MSINRAVDKEDGVPFHLPPASGETAHQLLLLIWWTLGHIASENIILSFFLSDKSPTESFWPTQA